MQKVRGHSPPIAPLSAALFLAAASAWADGPAREWEEIRREEGIRVWQRPIAGSSLVEFKGQAVVEASMKRVLAVLHDTDHKKEWMQNCVANQVLRLQGVGDRVVYNRTGSSFPLVSDRDVVVQTKLQWWTEQRRVRIDAWDIEDRLAPPVDGVIRMPDLHMAWDMRALDAHTTEVTYEVRADPGGAIPQWVVNLVAKDMPHHTLKNLRKETQMDRYEPAVAAVETFFDWPSVGL